MQNKSVVKILYNRVIISRWLLSRSDLMMTKELPHGCVPFFQQWYTLLIRAMWSLQRKTSAPEWSTFEIKHYIICDEVQKGERGSSTHISIDEQINKHLGEASVQDKIVCVLNLELVKMTSLLKKEEMTPRLGGSTGMYWFMDSHFSVRKKVQDEQLPFQFEKWIEISDGQRFPIVVNMGNGPGC